MPSLKQQLSDIRAKQKAKQAERAAKPKTQAKPAAGKKGPSEAEIKAAQLQKQMDELKAQQAALIEQQKLAAAAAQREEVVQYLTKAGARVNSVILSQVAPAVNPRTPEGRKALEEFRTANADIFNPSAKAPGDVSAGILDRIDKTVKSKGQTGIAERKVFDHELVKKTIAKNIGGDIV